MTATGYEVFCNQKKKHTRGTAAEYDVFSPSVCAATSNVVTCVCVSVCYVCVCKCVLCVCESVLCECVWSHVCV